MVTLSALVPLWLVTVYRCDNTKNARLPAEKIRENLELLKISVRAKICVENLNQIIFNFDKL
jgi:hypothetical protein